MCSDTKSNLESIEDFVFDQDKIVTYKWLSKKLNIHTNTAKQLLYTFSINSNENLLVTYLVSGSDPEGIKVYLVNQSEVDRVKSNLDTVLFEHVYSVQKPNSTVSSLDLYNADSSAQKCDKNLSSISQRKVEEREFKIVTADKSTAVSKPGLQKTSSKPVQKEAVQRPPFFKGKSSESVNKDKDDNTSSHISNKDAQVAKPGKSPVKSHVVSPTKHNQKKVSQTKGGNIGALFSKQNARNAEKKKNEPVVKETRTEDPKNITGGKSLKEDAHVSDDEEVISKMNIIAEKTVLKTPIASKKASKSRTTKRKVNREDDTPAKRRKRIVLASDSESSGEEEEADMDVEEEPQPDVGETSTQRIPESDDEIIPPTPFNQRAKKRIRKQVDRTFTDEDGFIVTKKEFVYESCSDNDENTDNNTKETDQNDSSKKTDKETALNDMEVSHKDESDSHRNESTEEIKTVEVKSKQSKKTSTGKGAKKSPKKMPSKANDKQKSITFFFKKN